MAKIDQLLGVCDPSLVSVPQQYTSGGSVLLHGDALAEFEQLHEAAALAGFDVRIASGYRSFERQLLIWNGKVDGSRPVLDAHECPLDTAPLTPEQLLNAVLRWSALPGMSRHHWGSDFDIFEAKALGERPLQLTVNEVDTYFAHFYEWLEGYLRQQPELFRPFDGRGGVAAEPWHLSYRPQALKAQALLSEEVMNNFYLTPHCSALALKELVLEKFSAIYEAYVRVYFI